MKSEAHLTGNKMNNHELWRKKEKLLLDEARKIYNESSDFDAQVDLIAIGDGIYDLMNEKDWEKFRGVERKITNSLNARDEENN